jgi:hypothetical protein
MGDTRVIITDTGSLILSIFGFQDKWIDGNNITVPEEDAKITDVEIMPDVQNDFFRHSKSQISWRVWAPHLIGEVVNTLKVRSEVGGVIQIGVEDDNLLHIRWDPPSDSGMTFHDWVGADDSGTLHSPANLKEARIDQIIVGDAPGITFNPERGTYTRMEVVSFGALFQFGRRPRKKAAKKKALKKKVRVRA